MFITYMRGKYKMKKIMKIGVLLLVATLVISGLGMTANASEIEGEKNIIYNNDIGDYVHYDWIIAAYLEYMEYCTYGYLRFE